MANIKMEFVSSKALNDMESSARIKYLLNVIRKGYIIVLEEKLNPDEERLLIEKTMQIVDNKFTGIEISSLGMQAESWKNAIIKLLGGKTSGLTVIGPAKLIKTIKNDQNKINLMAGLKGD